VYDKFIITKINNLRATLKTELQETKYIALRNEIRNRIGPLGRPSKMPGFSWGISASLCKTGSKLAQIEGTGCSVCYALRGRYPMDNVQDAMAERIAGYYDDPDWPELMSIRLLTYAKHHPYFRWFDSGDVQSGYMMEQIQKIANQTYGYVTHWLPTQERKIALEAENSRPDNLIVRVSSTKLGEQQNNHLFPTSFISLHETEMEGVFQCPSKNQDSKCKQCRACWNASVKCVEYHQH
jgi:hypothetical protein